MKDFLQVLQKETAQKIRQIEAAEKDTLKRAYSIVRVLEEANSRLKAFVIGYHFGDEQEEIHFFKHCKPYLMSRLIYHCQVYNLELNRPVGGVEVQRDYLNRKLENLQDDIDQKPEFYSYYRLGSTHYDACYFTREKRNNFEAGSQYLEPILGEREPKYSTNCDYRLSKILANERLEILLKSQLDELDAPRVNTPSLPWKATKNNLIELLYALHYYGAFGKIPFKQVIATVEQWLGISLRNHASSFSEMKTRNNPVSFLEALIDALLNNINRKRNKKKSK